MRINVLVAQFPVSLSVDENLTVILRLLDSAQPGDLVLFPEGALSGYARDLSFMTGLPQARLESAAQRLAGEARARRIHLWIGSLWQQNGRWTNAALGFTPNGERHIYTKVNLANNERGVLAAGDTLPCFRLAFEQGEVTVGVQICREIRYPEQWGWLARQGAQVFLHPDNATGFARALPIWRSHLVSRAAENQRYVLSANSAAAEQNCPTLIINPDGEVLQEAISAETVHLRATLDLDAISEVNFRQCRADLVRLTGTQPPLSP